MTEADMADRLALGATVPALRLVLVDYAATRRGIRLVLEPHATICAEADGLEAAVQAAKAQQPDLCLVRLGLLSNGARGVSALCRAVPDAAVVVLADDPDVDDMIDCVRAGAVGYVAGSLDAQQLQRIVSAAACGEAVLARSMVLALMLALRGVGRDGLTRREGEVLAMVRRGHTTFEIAQRLEIAPVTVRRHIAQVVRKLGVEDRSALIADDRAVKARRRSAQASPPRTA